VRTLACTPEDVEIVFDEVKKSNWASAGRLHSDPK
jgi:phenylpyruvate tautomerase PptA (4-oxalocrotonate tautomerase family)